MEGIESEELMKFFQASSKFMINATGMALDHNDAFNQSVAMLNKLTPSKRLSGLKMAANDTLDMIQELNPEQERVFEELLSKEGCRPLAFYRSKNRKVIKRLMGKSPLKRESDYYALKNHIESEWQKMDEVELEGIRKKLSEFENRQPKDAKI